MKIYYVSADQMGHEAARHAREFAAVLRRYLASLGVEGEVIVGAGINDDPELCCLGDHVLDVFDGEGFDTAAACATLGC